MLKGLEEEEETLDPYNLLQPNDCLLHLQQKKKERQNKELKLRVEETLKLQQTMRERIEEEREKAKATGDVEKICHCVKNNNNNQIVRG